MGILDKVWIKALRTYSQDKKLAVTLGVTRSLGLWLSLLRASWTPGGAPRKSGWGRTVLEKSPQDCLPSVSLDNDYGLSGGQPGRARLSPWDISHVLLAPVPGCLSGAGLEMEPSAQNLSTA